MSVKLIIGGKLYETTINTLKHSNFFNNMFNDTNFNNNEPIIIDRSASGFEQVLDFLRDPNYKIDFQYKYELDYYGISYTNDNFKLNLYDLQDKIDILIKKLD